MTNVIKSAKDLVKFDADTTIALDLQINQGQKTEDILAKAENEIQDLIQLGIKPENIALIGAQSVMSDVNKKLEQLTSEIGATFGGALDAVVNIEQYLFDLDDLIKNKIDLSVASQAKSPDDIPVDESIVKKYARKVANLDILGNEQINFPDTFIAEERPIDRKTPISDWKDKTAVNADLAGGGTLKEKPSEFAAQYGKNVVVKSNAGHFIEMDDTEGAERINIQHKNGSFITIHADKSIVIRGQNGIQLITYANNELFVGGNINITVIGDANISTNGDANIDTLGDVNWKVGGDFNLDVAGDTTVFNKAGDIKMTAKQIRQNAGDPRVLDDVKEKKYKLGS